MIIIIIIKIIYISISFMNINILSWATSLIVGLAWLWKLSRVAMSRIFVLLTEPKPSGQQAEATDQGSAHHMKTHQRRLHLSSLALRQPLPQLPRSRCPHLLSLNSVKCKSIGVVASFSNPSPSHSAPPIQSLIVTNQPCKSSYMWH